MPTPSTWKEFMDKHNKYVVGPNPAGVPGLGGPGGWPKFNIPETTLVKASGKYVKVEGYAGVLRFGQNGRMLQILPSGSKVLIHGDPVEGGEPITQEKWDEWQAASKKLREDPDSASDRVKTLLGTLWGKIMGTDKEEIEQPSGGGAPLGKLAQTNKTPILDNIKSSVRSSPQTLHYLEKLIAGVQRMMNKQPAAGSPVTSPASWLKTWNAKVKANQAALKSGSKVA